MGNRGRTSIAIAAALSLRLLPAAGREPAEVLREAVAKVLASSQHAVDYTCVQNTERHYYRPVSRVRPKFCPVIVGESRDPAKVPNLVLEFTDRLRLDVTTARSGELYSWAGASRFDDAGIDKIIREGPFGTGAFASFLDMIFQLDVRAFRFEGDKLVEAVDAMEFSFRVAAKDSHYRVKVDDSWRPTGYFGSVFVDAANGDVIRLSLETLDPDFGNGNCQTVSTLDFGTVQIGAEPFLLPIHSRQLFFLASGAEIENTTSFTSCREYRGESTIIFAAPSDSAPDPVKAPARGPVAGGTTFQLQLLDPIDPRTAAAGDVFRAKLIGTLRDANKQTLAKTGSIVEGRLKRVQIYAKPPVADLVLAPAVVLVENQRVPLAANRSWTGTAGMSYILVPRSGERPAGVFRLRGANLSLPRGFRSDWRTVAVTGR
ncbi:MAG TPA: hypothetical protein VMB03_09105 [Bryobacteraceae bacterium]|nr:hypothetical protein [Bryobacteraceae bacterium]